MADNDGFKLPGSSYEELMKIVHAWGLSTGSSSNEEVGRLAGVDPSTISRNNGFLESVGVLASEGRKKVPTELGVRLARAIEHKHEEEFEKCWSEAVQTTRFLQDILSAVRIRHGMDDAALERHIGFNAGQSSNAKTRAGVRTVIQVMERSGALRFNGDKYVVASGESKQQPQSAPETNPASAPTKPAGTSSSLRSWSTSVLDSLPGSSAVVGNDAISLDIRINVELSVTPNELPELGRALRELREQLRERPSDDRGTSADD